MIAYAVSDYGQEGQQTRTEEKGRRRAKFAGLQGYPEKGLRRRCKNSKFELSFRLKWCYFRQKCHGETTEGNNTPGGRESLQSMPAIVLRSGRDRTHPMGGSAVLNDGTEARCLSRFRGKGAHEAEMFRGIRRHRGKNRGKKKIRSAGDSFAHGMGGPLGDNPYVGPVKTSLLG